MMLGELALPTTTKIVASKYMYVLGGVSQLIVYACDIGAAVVFYELFKVVGKRVALLATFFRLAFVAVASANLVNHFAPLIFLGDSGFLSVFTAGQLQALAMAFIRLRTFGFDIALVFFGFHCILIGYLIFKSNFLPRILGVGLAIGGMGYLANIAAIAGPPVVPFPVFPYIMLPAGLAEVCLTLWLIIAGVNIARWDKQANMPTTS